MTRLNDNVKNILSPKTMYQHRKPLQNILQNLRGQVRPIKESVEEVKHTKLSLMMDIKEKESLKKGLKPIFQKLCRVWIDRARRLQKIRSEVAGIIELMTDPYCQFCQVDFGLRCETINNIEIIFMEFVRDINHGNFSTWNLIAWQEYFTSHSIFRTLCYECYEELIPQNYR